MPRRSTRLKTKAAAKSKTQPEPKVESKFTTRSVKVKTEPQVGLKPKPNPAKAKAVKKAQSVLVHFQKMLGQIEHETKDNKCFQHNAFTCKGECEFMYSMWACVPKGLRAKPLGDVRVAAYVLLHSPRLLAGVKALLDTFETNAASKQRSVELQQTMRDLLGDEAWEELIQDPSNEDTVRRVASIIIFRSRDNAMDSLKLSCMLALAAGLAMKTLSLSTGVISSIAGFVISVLSILWSLVSFLPSTLVWAGNASIWLLLLGSFVFFSMLQYFRPGSAMSLRALRDTFGTWLSSFERAISGIENKKQGSYSDGIMASVSSASDFFMNLYSQSVSWLPPMPRVKISFMST